jgi:hypothetical protein
MRRLIPDGHGGVLTVSSHGGQIWLSLPEEAQALDAWLTPTLALELAGALQDAAREAGVLGELEGRVH